MDRLFGDLSSGVRMLVRYPTLSLGAVLTLGAGIGLSTTVFCVVNSGMFKGLPFPNADRIVAVFSSNAAQGQPRLPVSVHDLAIHQARQTSFEAIGPYGSGPYNLSLEAGRPERFQGGQLSLEAFKALGVQPLLGRGFQAGDDLPGAGNVVLLGHDLWRDRYGSAPDIVGRAIRANGTQLTVIGVMPPKFAFPIRGRRRVDKVRGIPSSACSNAVSPRSRRPPSWPRSPRRSSASSRRPTGASGRVSFPIPSRCSCPRSTRCCSRCWGPASACC
jgi:putative ABC transport system permease protein